MFSKGVFKNIIVSTGIAIFLFVSFFGVIHMGMAPGDGMDNCPFSFGISLCTMTPLQHIGAAQSFLNGLSTQTEFAYFLLLTVFSILLLTFFFIKLFSPPKPALAYSRFYHQRFDISPTFLQQAFSRGILNSKTF